MWEDRCGSRVSIDRVAKELGIRGVQLREWVQQATVALQGPPRSGESPEQELRARVALFRYIQAWCNRVRLHSTLGYLSPAQYEVHLQTKPVA